MFLLLEGKGNINNIINCYLKTKAYPAEAKLKIKINAKTKNKNFPIFITKPIYKKIQLLFSNAFKKL